jgi:uncharacterized protein (DUF1778 family)
MQRRHASHGTGSVDVLDRDLCGIWCRSKLSVAIGVANALGRNRSDLVLEAACREAEPVLLDRRDFTLPEDDFERFTAMLDKPPANHPRLARLLRAKAPWDK